MRSTFAITFIFVILVSVQGELRHLIESPQATNWGTWGEVDRCPPGTFATGMQLKVESSDGWKDDRGLTGLKFFCSRLGEDVGTQEPFAEVITSSVGSWGSWKLPFHCGDDAEMNRGMSAVVGFQLRSEQPKGVQDDTAANNLRIICADFSIESNPYSSVIEGDGTHWGSWTDSQFCRKGFAVCGLITQVDHGQGKSYDGTALNNVKAECCKIQFSSEEDIQPESPLDTSLPDPIESAKNLSKHIHLSKSKSTGDPVHVHKSESFEGDKAILSFSPEDVQDAPEIQESPTHSDNHEEEVHQEGASTLGPHVHALASHELNRLADLDFGAPDISVTVKVPVLDENQSKDRVNATAIPDVPPEVITFIKAEENDEDPDPSHVNVISGRIRSETKIDETHGNSSALEAPVQEIHASVSSSNISVPVPLLCLFLVFIRPLCLGMIL